MECGGIEQGRGRSRLMISGHAADAAAIAMRQPPPHGQASYVACCSRTATLALAGAAERQHQQRQRADQQDGLNLVLADRARTTPLASAIHSGRATCGAASGHDQDQQREDDRAGRDKLAAQDARVHGDAAGERERNQSPAARCASRARSGA